MIKRFKDESGTVLVIVTASMTVMLAAAALAVDVGPLKTAGAESTRIAEAAALVGAGVLRNTNGDSAAAHNAVISWVAENSAPGEFAPMLNEDVEVIPGEWAVRVRVRRTVPLMRIAVPAWMRPGQ
ncbi:MAG: hypothetical protein ABFS14_06845 [Gemmatimonadota bacterium]